MIGADCTVMWYRKQDGTGRKITGASWQEAQIRASTDQRGRNGSTKGALIDQGERLKREVFLTIPRENLPEDYPEPQGAGGIAVGDHFLLGEGNSTLLRPSELERGAGAHFTVRAVSDRRFGLRSDHIRVRGY